MHSGEKVKILAGPRQQLAFSRWSRAVYASDIAQQMAEEFLKRNKFPAIRLHDLRHISASLLIAAGVPIRVVSERLGHSKTTTIQEIYALVIRQMDEAAARVFDDIVSIGVPDVPNGVPKTES